MHAQPHANVVAGELDQDADTAVYDTPDLRVLVQG